MDPLTHALASYSLKRAAFPQATRPATIAILAAGIFADLDGQSFHWGPSAFLTFYRTYFHSVIAAVLLSLAGTLPVLRRKREPGAKHVPSVPVPSQRRAFPSSGIVSSEAVYTYANSNVAFAQLQTSIPAQPSLRADPNPPLPSELTVIHYGRNAASESTASPRPPVNKHPA